MYSKHYLVILLSIFLFIIPSTIVAETIIFEDDFNAETNVPWIYNYDSFANWNVTDGTVDLISADHPGFAAFTLNGMFIDLDGTTNDPGRMQSKTSFTFYPGYNYEFFFDIAGSQRPQYGDNNTVTVSLGNIYSEDFTLNATDPFQTIQHVFDVTTPTNAKLIFDHWGPGDSVGLLLDNIRITSPEPTSVPDASVMLLLGPCLMSLAVFSRKRKRSQSIPQSDITT